MTGHQEFNGTDRQVAIHLEHRSFFRDWSDFVVEELPRKEGAIYRMYLWSPAAAGQPEEEAHAFLVRPRESVEVFGRTRTAWPVDDRGPDGTLRGTMWIVDEAPGLIRWDLIGPTGPVARIEHELAGASR